MLNHSRKVIFSILALALLVAVPLAYAAVETFILSFDGTDNGGTVFDNVSAVVTDSNNRIIVTDSDTPLVQIFDASGNFVVALTGGTALQAPIGLAVDSNNRIFVLDNGNDESVQIFTSAGAFVAGSKFDGSNGAGDQFASPSGIAIDSNDRILVGDGTRDKVQIYNSAGTFLDSFNGADTAGGTDFEAISSIEVDSNNRIIVGDTIINLVQIFTSDGTFVASLTGGVALTNPRGIGVDDINRIYVGDTNTDSVQIFNSDGTFLSNFDGSDGAASAFQLIEGVTIDSNNRILVTDSGPNNDNKVLIYEGLPLTPTVTDKPSGGSGDQAHKTRPTFGLSHTTFAQQVDGGFSFNGKSHDITHNFWTPFEEQPVKLGEMNSFTAKVLAEQKLMVQEFLFGIPEIGEAHNAELGVEIFYNYDGTVERVQVIQKTDIIDVDSVKIMHSMTNCLSNETDEKCDITHLSMKFLEPLKHNVMAVKAIDFKGRSHFTYLNDGFDISGNSLNPMNTKLIPGTAKHEGLIEVTQIAKYSDIWVAKDGREFEANEYDSFKQINQTFERHIDTDALKSRSHSEFYRLAEYEINRAQMLLEQLCAHCSDEEFGEINDIFAYDYPETIYSIDNPELQKNLVIESEKAQKIMEHLLDASLSSKIKYLKTLSLEEIILLFP